MSKRSFCGLDLLTFEVGLIPFQPTDSRRTRSRQNLGGEGAWFSRIKAARQGRNLVLLFCVNDFCNPLCSVLRRIVAIAFLSRIASLLSVLSEQEHSCAVSCLSSLAAKQKSVIPSSRLKPKYVPFLCLAQPGVIVFR